MSNAEQSSVVTLDITNAPTLDALFQRFHETDVSNIVDTITFDPRSRTFMFHLHRLVRASRQPSGSEDSAEARIRNLSDTYKHKYSELLEHFKEWQPLREELIQILKTSSHKLERNSSFVSGFRIITSAADILGTFMQYQNGNDDSVGNFLMANASVCGLSAVFLESYLTLKIHDNVKEAVKEDQECFEKIEQWFKQDGELDETIRNFFPYGIDKTIVKKIEAISNTPDDCLKLFDAIVTTNVKQNVKLFKNVEFLDIACRLASSEVGKLWFHKVLVENDPCFVHTINTKLNHEIQELLKISPIKCVEICVDSYREFTSTIRMKIILNALTIVSAASNLWEGNPEKSDYKNLKKLLKKVSNELEKIRHIVLLLNPSGSQIDPMLQ